MAVVDDTIVTIGLRNDAGRSESPVHQGYVPLAYVGDLQPLQRGGGIVVRGDGHEGRAYGPHLRPVPCLRKFLEDRRRGVLLGKLPCLLEPLGEDHASVLVAIPALFVQFEHLFGDEVGKGGDNTLSPRTEPPPEVVLRTEEHAFAAFENGLGLASPPPRSLTPQTGSSLTIRSGTGTAYLGMW